MSVGPPPNTPRRKLDIRDQRYIQNGGGNASKPPE
jgi:hypothetical protein